MAIRMKRFLPTPVSLRSKIIALSCATSLVASLAVVWMTTETSNEKLSQTEAQSRLALEAQKTSIRLEEDFLALIEDAHLLSNTPSVKAVVDQTNTAGTASIEQRRRELAFVFTSVLEIRPWYTQVRLIGFDNNGREIVRVNRTPRGMEVVPDDALQEKEHEPYIQRALSRNDPAPFFSKVSLNRENGIVSEDRTVTIRLVRPVYHKDGTPFGVIVINANYAGLLKHSVTSTHPGVDTFIFNKAGDVLEFRKADRQLTFHLANDVPSEIASMGEAIETAPGTHLRQQSGDFFYGENVASPLNSTGLDLYIAQSLSATSIAASRNNRLIALGAIGLCLVLAIAASGFITHPLRVMMRRLIALRDNDHPDPSSLESLRFDELSEFDRTLDDLVRRLEENQDSTRKIISNVVDGIIVIDEHGRIETFNPACERLFGYNAEEVIGRNVRMLMSKTHADKHQEYLSSYTRTGATRIIGKGREILARRKSGEEFVIDMSVSEIMEGGRHYFCGILRDMTETLKSRNALKEQKDTLEFALESGELGLWDINPIAGTLRLSPVCARFIGFEPETLKDDISLWADRIEPSDLKRLQEYLEAMRRGEIDRYETEFRIRHRNGQWVWLQTKGKAFERNPQNLITRVVGIHLNITQRKQIEIMKSEFVSTVNHELRTPLTSIYGSLDLLIQSGADQLDKRGRRLVELAHDSCGRLATIVNDILDLEKIAAGKMEYRIETHELTALVDDIVQRNQVIAERVQVCFVTEHACTGVEVDVDENRFCQAVVNLLSNAAKFSPARADVTIRTEFMGDDTVRISVADKGNGIPEAFRKRLFERFAQADSSTTRSTTGTGLGLSITKSIIEAFSGTIGFETEDGVGTTFYFDLPISQHQSYSIRQAS